ncbi:MAG: hypothetical protein WA383_20080, partial [Terriglobales bacterium]
AMEAPKKFPFAPAKSPRRVFPQVDPDKTAAAKRAHDVRGLDFFLLLVLHELGHGLANKLCGRACSIQIEKSGFAYTCHDPAHKLDQADEIFVAAIGGSVHLAFVLALPAVTPRFLQQYVAHAINRDAQLAGVRPEFLHALIQNEVLPHISEPFIANMMQFAEAVAKDSKRNPDLCHYAVTDDAKRLMPEVFQALTQIRKAIKEPTVV